jgi:hypothetical protein
MLSRKQFFKELILRTAGAAARLCDNEGAAPDAGDRRVEPAFVFTELSPSLLAMEAERLGTPAGSRDAESLRQRLHMQMKQQVPAPGPVTEKEE